MKRFLLVLVSVVVIFAEASGRKPPPKRRFPLRDKFLAALEAQDCGVQTDAEAEECEAALECAQKLGTILTTPEVNPEEGTDEEDGAEEDEGSVRPKRSPKGKEERKITRARKLAAKGKKDGTANAEGKTKKEREAKDEKLGKNVGRDGENGKPKTGPIRLNRCQRVQFAFWKLSGRGKRCCQQVLRLCPGEKEV